MLLAISNLISHLLEIKSTLYIYTVYCICIYIKEIEIQAASPAVVTKSVVWAQLHTPPYLSLQSLQLNYHSLNYSSTASSVAWSNSSSEKRSPEMARWSSGTSSTSMLLSPAWQSTKYASKLLTDYYTLINHNIYLILSNVYFNLNFLSLNFKLFDLMQPWYLSR